MPKAKPAKKAATGGKRKLSPYNAFMKAELPKVKAENPNLEHKAAFKLVAERWKNSPDNPKNQGS
ncbi:13535_t:CDS:2 [Ambispora leptoticha]|uniref:13535_t:CDS:1 n=1 Tax=Ambispora leptoticha TaxID=144679 RepID=A0A9N9N4U2_9GLOM|nr:13535_t:CDS:2 [Ambispora leptoticha]